MRFKDSNWYGFDHKSINIKFEGELTYCNTFCVLGQYHPVAVYKCKKPNKSKGHKKYVLLGKNEYGYYVSGMTSAQMKKERYQTAMLCKKCNIVFYSVMRHDNNSCLCGNSIDGGKDYTKTSGQNFVLITLDLITNETFKEIPLTKGKTALVDIDDYESVRKYSWRANKKGNWYALRSVTLSKPRRHLTFKMHREILGITDPKVMIDHINGNGLDNRKHNLRIATNSQNQANAVLLNKRNKSGYRGVFQIKHKTTPWQAQIWTKGQPIKLGKFDNKIDAAKAYNIAAQKYFGKFAKLNIIE